MAEFWQGYVKVTGTHTLLVGMSSCVDALENWQFHSVLILHFLYCPGILLFCIYPREMKTQDPYTDVYSILSYSSSNQEIPNRYMGNLNVAYPHNGIQLGK